MMITYILQLTHGKYYVGRTNNLEKRVCDHTNGNGAAWTKKYGVIRVMETHNNDSRFFEDMLVKTMMHKYGIDNVRGGSYVQVNLPQIQYQCLQREINGATDKCFNCGGDHFVSNCDVVNDDLSWITDLGYRMCASGIRKTKRMIDYFWG